MAKKNVHCTQLMMYKMYIKFNKSNFLKWESNTQPVALTSRHYVSALYTYWNAIINSSSNQRTILTAANDALLGKSSLPPTTPRQIFSDKTVWFFCKHKNILTQPITPMQLILIVLLRNIKYIYIQKII